MAELKRIYDETHALSVIKILSEAYEKLGVDTNSDNGDPGHEAKIEIACKIKLLVTLI